uniref:Uncharacterized protein n=1 Tax=Glossina morsitans morsitans TaxID=37546 RepID=A0ABK9NFX3_GLOMM
MNSEVVFIYCSFQQFFGCSFLSRCFEVQSSMKSFNSSIHLAPIWQCAIDFDFEIIFKYKYNGSTLEGFFVIDCNHLGSTGIEQDIM